MSDLPKITARKIESHVGSRSFGLGQEYFQDNAIFDARRTAMTLKARCHGSRGASYRVEVTLDHKGIAAADCSCPVGGGGACKHVAALLLTWLHRPEAFAESLPLEQALASRSKDELIALIRLMLRQEPDLESLLETPLPAKGAANKPASPDVYRRQVQAIFNRADYDQWGVAGEIADQISAIAELGDEFLQHKDHASAAAVFQGIASAVLEEYLSIEDEEGDLGMVLDQCVEGLGKCLPHQKDNPALRQATLRTLFDISKSDVDAGGRGVGDDAPDLILEHATPEERQTVAQWVRQAMPKKGADWSADFHRQVYGGLLMDLEEDKLDDEAYLRLCRETGRQHDLVDRLLTLNRLDEALREAEQARDFDLLHLANLFVAHKHPDVAEGLVLKRSRTSQDARLLEWLKNRAIAKHDDAAALNLANRLFRIQPSLAEYEQIKKLAAKLNQWEQSRPQLLAHLKTHKRTDLLIDIHLKEGDIDQALDLAQSIGRSFYGYGAGRELDVAKAAEKTRPRGALEIYRKYAESLIVQRNRESYRAACTYLKKVKTLYAALGEDPAWNKYIAALRQTNEKLRALLEELQKAKL